MPETWTFHSAGELLFGRGAAREMGRIADQHQIKRLLVVTDMALIEAGLLQVVRAPLEEAGVRW